METRKEVPLLFEMAQATSSSRPLGVLTIPHLPSNTIQGPWDRDIQRTNTYLCFELILIVLLLIFSIFGLWFEDEVCLWFWNLWTWWRSKVHSLLHHPAPKTSIWILGFCCAVWSWYLSHLVRPPKASNPELAREFPNLEWIRREFATSINPVRDFSHQPAN